MNRFLVKFWNRSFRLQLIYAMGFVLTLLIVAFTYITTKNHRDFLYAEGLEQAQNRSLALATTSKVWVMANDYIGLDEIINNFSVYDDLVFATVINMEGKIIAHTDTAMIGEYIADEERISYLKKSYEQRGEHEADEEVLLHNTSYIDIVRMIHNGQQHLGMVHLRLDQNSRQQNIDDTILQGVLFTFLSLILTVFFAYLTANSLVGQLMHLIRTMKKVRHGNKSVRANEEGVRELSILSSEFNSMLEALDSSEKLSKKLQERLEFAVNGTTDGLWDWNIIEDTIYFSPQWKNMLGYKEDELPDVFETWKDNVHPDDIEQAEHDVQVCHERPGILYENIHRLRHKDGHWVWILGRGQTIFNEDGKAARMVGFNTDISKQKQLEQELIEKEDLMLAQSRHSAMGEMIGMIAHQWRQPITVIAMDANNMLVDIELDCVDLKNFKSQAENILGQTEYLSKTIDDFRNFFRPNNEKEEIKISKVLEEAKQIIGKTLDYNDIEFRVVDNDTEAVLIYSRELLQVFINLMKNSTEALVENTEENRYIHVNVEDSGEAITINICDNAGGVDEKIIHTIFEPYFSTKDEKTGTGLGLYMSKTIIEKHFGGKIIARNSDKEFCFDITLPKCTQGELGHA